MRIDERLPQQLLLAVAGVDAGRLRAQALVDALRSQDMPALLALIGAPRDTCSAHPDLQLKAGACTSVLRQLQPSLVLVCDTSIAARNLLLSARLAGLKVGLWLPLGVRAPWWARWSHLRLPCYQGHDVLLDVAAVASYLRAEALGMGAGVERLIVNPLGRAAARLR